MRTHAISDDDRRFLDAFEACEIAPAAFDHPAHVRLAYACLVGSDVECAVRRMRDGLLAFLDHHGAPRAKYHETITRAWVMAVRHFMDRADATSFADFIGRSRALLDASVMLTHYSATRLFSAQARAAFVEPDLDPIPPPRVARAVSDRAAGRA